MSLIECPIYAKFKSNPSAEALRYNKQRFTYEELHMFICQHEAILSHHVRGAVLIILPSDPFSTLCHLFAFYRLGLIPFILNPGLPKKSILNYKRKAVAIDIINCTPIDHSENIIIEPKKKQISPTQIASYLLTSGTTGDPKIAVHRLENYIESAKGVNQAIKIAADDAWLVTLPLYHVAGLAILWRCLLSGATVILSSNSQMEVTIRDESVTHLSVVSTQLQRLLNNHHLIPKLARLKLVLCGGSAFPENLLSEAAKHHLPIKLSYGLTEMSSTVLLDGQLLKNHHLKINKNQKLMIKSTCLFMGYLDAGQIKLDLDADAYFDTGDLAQEKAGKKIHILRRKDQMFISGGENIQPEEIAQHIKNFNGVEDCLVLPKSDPEFGFRPVAIIKGVVEIKGKAGLRHYLLSILPKFKVPDDFISYPTDIYELKIQKEKAVDLLHSYLGK